MLYFPLIFNSNKKTQGCLRKKAWLDLKVQIIKKNFWACYLFLYYLLVVARIKNKMMIGQVNKTVKKEKTVYHQKNTMSKFVTCIIILQV